MVGINENFCEKLPNIKKIDLSKNHLTELNGESVFLQMNKNRTEYSVFSKCINVTEKLKLSDNKIDKFYDDWKDSLSLRSLQLANNQISKITVEYII